METFKLIEGTGHFEVSDLGRVRNAKTGTVLKQRCGSSPYLCVSFGGRTRLVHRLVAQAFIPNPENKPTVNHKRGLKSDNRASELEWATYSENNQHMYDTGLKAYQPLHYKGKLGAEHNRSLTVEQVDEFGVVVATHAGISEASRATGIGISSIHYACHKHGINRKTKCFFRFAFS